jgi:hypothetical protein
MTSSRAAGIADALTLFRRRSGIIGESFPVDDATGVLTPSTGMLYLTSLFVERGETVTNLIFKTGTTASGTPTNWWFGLWTHDTAGAPVLPLHIPTTYSVTRTSGSPTLTIVTGTFPNSLVARLVTGTGIPAATRIISQTSTTLTMSANASSGSATVTTITPGQYAGPRQNIGVTADSTNSVVAAADTFHSKALATPWICPGSGLYFAGWMLATGGTQANIVGKQGAAAIGTTTLNHLAHSNAGPHTTPPGAANPIASVTDVVNWPWVGFS